MSNIVLLYHPAPLALRREWGFAPLCGAAAISMAALKAPVAPEEGTTLGVTYQNSGFA